MVKEINSMINHILSLNNYSQNSQTDAINFSKLSSNSQNSMAILKCSPNKKQTTSTTQPIHVSNINSSQFRNGQHHTLSNHRIMNNPNCAVFEVYSNNLLEGSRLIRHLAKCSDIVAIDTEFPGVVCRINGEYSSTTSLSYHNIKCNTDLMKPIQIGFSFFNKTGEQSDTVNATVQFNLKWDMGSEVFAHDSITLLENSGINFQEHKHRGIEAHDFAEIFLASGLPLNDNITWIGFHCAYDWAYMMKICTNLPDIPESYEEFNDLFLLYFPKTIDIKTIMTDKNLPKSGLQDLARSLNVERIGMQHQAGSDAKLTGDTFFSFYKTYCNGVIEDKYINLIYGLNYCPTSGANMLWLPNQSPIPDENNTGAIDNNGILVSSSTNSNSITSMNSITSNAIITNGTVTNANLSIPTTQGGCSKSYHHNNHHIPLQSSTPHQCRSSNGGGGTSSNEECCYCCQHNDRSSLTGDGPSQTTNNSSRNNSPYNTTNLSESNESTNNTTNDSSFLHHIDSNKNDS